MLGKKADANLEAMYVAAVLGATSPERADSPDQEARELVEAVYEASFVGGTLVEQVPDPPEGAPLAQEWRTFKRELRRLLAQGDKGRFAVIKGDRVVSVWDTLRDALQAGREHFGTEMFMVQEVQRFVRPVRSGYYRTCPS